MPMEATSVDKGTTDDRHPVWMPDGKSLVFDSSDGTRREIWKVTVADGSTSQLTRMDGLANFAAPSPDGRRMAFYLLKDDELNLWTAQPDGKDAKPLTRDLASTKNNQCTFACHQAAWSADSQRIAYSGGDHRTIWMAQSDGTNAQELIADGEHNHFPWFLSDGRLGYIIEHVEAADKAWTAAWAYDFKTGQRTVLQNEIAMQGPFEWSNDSTKVLFHSPRSGKFEIYMIDLTAAGGVDALRGKTILPEQIKNADSVNTTRASEASSLPISMALLLGAGLLAVFSLVGVGLVVRLRRK
jgi:TolB protein